MAGGLERLQSADFFAIKIVPHSVSAKIDCLLCRFPAFPVVLVACNTRNGQALRGYENDGVYDWSQPSVTESMNSSQFNKQARREIILLDLSHLQAKCKPKNITRTVGAFTFRQD